MAEDIPYKVRLICYERDSYKCRWCGRQNVAIHLHHVRYRSEGGKHVPENLISLCPEHHAEAHSDKNQYQDLLLDVLGMEANVTVVQLQRWRKADKEPDLPVFNREEATGPVRRFLDLDSSQEHDT